MKAETKATIQMLICSLLWSISAIFIKQIDWNPVVISGIRSLFASITIFLFMKAKNYCFAVNSRSIKMGLSLCATFLLFVTANKLTTAANAIVLQFTSPVFILIFSSVFLKQKLSHKDVIAVFFTFVGIALFFFDDMSGGHLAGNIVAIGSGVCLALAYMSIGGGNGNERMSGIFLGNFFTALVGIVALFITKPVIMPKEVLFIIILGVFQLGIPYILLVFASEYCPPLACSLLGALEPLLNPLWVFLLNGEHPGALAFVGAIVVVATITIWCLTKDSAKNCDTPPQKE